MNVQILPSLLAADAGQLAAEIRRAEAAGADALHLDIMDGHFVPNLSFGPSVVKMARDVARIPLSVHLMLSRPDQYIRAFAEAGSDSILIHVEAECDVLGELRRIRDMNVRPGVVLNPETPAEMVFPALDHVREVLCMSVHPGYGGQSFLPGVLPKIRAIREEALRQGLGDLDIMVDGGINDRTAVSCAGAGANLFVAGTWLFEASDMGAMVARLRRAAEEALVL